MSAPSVRLIWGDIGAAQPENAVAVIGLHTVFEHHDAMTPVSLAAFLHEYRITFPVGVDTPGKGSLPRNMDAFQMRGTPSMLLFDKAGTLRAHHFRDVSELGLAAEIATLLCEGETTSLSDTGAVAEGAETA